MNKIYPWKYDYTLNGGQCFDCGAEYGSTNYIELVLPHDLWEKINPTKEKGCGLLCHTCILQRLSSLGVWEGVSFKICINEHQRKYE